MTPTLSRDSARAVRAAAVAFLVAAAGWALLVHLADGVGGALFVPGILGAAFFTALILAVNTGTRPQKRLARAALNGLVLAAGYVVAVLVFGDQVALSAFAGYMLFQAVVAWALLVLTVVARAYLASKR